jgi:hypothetical protein
MAASPSAGDALGIDAIPLCGAWAGRSDPPPSVVRRVAIGAARRPNDEMAQAGAALWRIQGSPSVTGRDLLTECSPLLQRYPTRPEVYANVLRVAAAGLAFPKHPGAGAAVHPAAQTSPSTSAEDWNRYLRVARAGERLDPANGYFTSLAAVALFALGRDRDALAALDAAAAKPLWREYLPEITKGTWRAGDASFGAGNTFWRLSIPASVTFPHAALLARVGVRFGSDAVSLDRAGHKAEAARIRRILLSLGARMRNESTSMVGVTVGRRMQLIALGRQRQSPGGPPIPAGPPLPGLPRPSAPPSISRQTPIAELSPPMQAQMRANDEVSAILSAGTERFDVLRGLRGYALWYLAGQLLIDSSLWLIALGAIAWLAGRMKHRSGVWAASALGLAVLCVGCVRLAQGMSALDPALHAANQTKDLTISWMLLTLATLLPSAIVFAIISVEAYGDGEPAGQRYFRRFAMWCIPAACTVTVLYGLLTVHTVRVGETMNRSLIRMVENEGRFYAELAGRPWPNVPLTP